MSRKPIDSDYGFTKWNRLLYSKTKIPSKFLVEHFSKGPEDTHYIKRLDNFEIIEIVNLYNRFKDTDTYRFEFNHKVLSMAYDVMKADPNK